jgi:hypothetical protein
VQSADFASHGKHGAIGRRVILTKVELSCPSSTQLNSAKFLIAAVIIVALILTVPHFVATTSGAYKLAVATAHQKAQFKQTLGSPITEAWFSEGKQVWGNPATAEVLIPVRGQIRSGNLRARAIKDDGSWRLTELTLELTSPDEHIDLLGKTPI